MIKAAVNCLVTEPISKIAVGDVVWRVVRSETPYPWRYSIVPFFARATVIPGIPCCCIAACATPSTVLLNDEAGGGGGAFEPPQPAKAIESPMKKSEDRNPRMRAMLTS